jgi:hypothetical protein
VEVCLLSHISSPDSSAFESFTDTLFNVILNIEDEINLFKTGFQSHIIIQGGPKVGIQ